MRKESYHDYVIEAMRYYALCGYPDAATIESLAKQAHETKKANPCCRDLKAVERMLYRLENEEYGSIGVECVKLVYLKEPRILYSRGEITLRVEEAAEILGLCESSIYKALKRARTLVALELGLRVDAELWVKR